MRQRGSLRVVGIGVRAPSHYIARNGGADQERRQGLCRRRRSFGVALALGAQSRLRISQCVVFTRKTAKRSPTKRWSSESWAACGADSEYVSWHTATPACFRLRRTRRSAGHVAKGSTHRWIPQSPPKTAFLPTSASIRLRPDVRTLKRRTFWSTSASSIRTRRWFYGKQPPSPRKVSKTTPERGMSPH